MSQSKIPAIVSTAGTGFTAVASGLIASGALSTAGGTGAFLAAAIPIIGPAIAGVTIGLSLLFGRKGPRQKVATTQIVNQVEPLLQQNLQGYLEGPRTESARRQALENFDAAWQWLREHCDIPEMGDPGQACVSDRQAGACQWRGEDGDCWNWFKGYRDPIANDRQVKADPVLTQVFGSDAAAAGFDLRSLLVPALLLGLAWVVA